MKSIRLSLVVYFLALLGLALGAVSLLAYRTAWRTLAEKEQAAESRILAQYDERERKERHDVDADLLFQAHALARLVQFEPIEQMRLQTTWWNEWNTWRDLNNRPPPIRSVTFLAAVSGMHGPLVHPLWLAGAHPTPFLPRGPWTEIKVDEKAIPERLGVRAPDYFQVDSSGGSTFRSESLQDLDLYLPFDKPTFRANPVYDYNYDDLELEPGFIVRRVTLKVPHGQYLPLPGRGRSRPPSHESRTGPPKMSSEPRPGPPRPEPRPGPAILIQCALDAERLDTALAGFAEERDQELRELREAGVASLAFVRNSLLLVNLVTFLAAVAGVLVLVRAGLLPLQRLSDAVSRVSEKDFRLHFEERRLPSELAPIVGRLERTLDQLRHAFDREKQAAADISHELRTPVAALLTTIDVALRKPRKPEEYRETLQDCRASGQQISQLVERLLTLARLDAGVDRLRVETVDASGVAEQCAALVRPLAEARGLALRLHAAEPAEWRADPAKLREVITNLLHNAIEYNRPNGSVELTVARHNGTLRVEVADTGIGIAPEARAHLFERFYRADPSRHAEGLHAGLGLAIVKGYVDLMGGSIDVESEPGRGSTFRVELPAGVD